MKTARLHGIGDLRVADEPVPEPGPGETLAPLATERFGLASAGPAFGSAAKRQGLKVIIEPAA